MRYIFAPWRMDYILSKKPENCFLCEKYDDKNDKENWVLYRNSMTMVILNQYPYNNGHLMVVPKSHYSQLSSFSQGEICQLFLVVQSTSMILQERFKPHGLNVGINVGKSAGAGLEEHLHVHILPRWEGDSNFMTTIFETRTIPETLDETYVNLLPYFRNPKFFKNL